MQIVSISPAVVHYVHTSFDGIGQVYRRHSTGMWEANLDEIFVEASEEEAQDLEKLFKERMGEWN